MKSILETMAPGEALIRDPSRGLWLRFRDPVERIVCTEIREVSPALERLHNLVESRRLYAAGFLSYDAAPAFDEVLRASRDPRIPLLAFSLFPEPEPLRPDFSLPDRNVGNPEWRPLTNREEYGRALGRVKEYIRRGETYQVNYTYRMEAEAPEDPRRFFAGLQSAGEARYGALLLEEDYAVCSASPELFFSLEGEDIVTRPMKGTAARGRSSGEDKRAAEELHGSEKNRAENLMITDMIRNDLGRIARPGSVCVPGLFTLERYPTLWQMTSEVHAKTDASVPELLDALFPCASITGAPKVRTMEIIEELEGSARGLYTGSIGWWGPDRRALFNVAIRSTYIDRIRNTALYGTGGGIVWDSDTEGEYDESLLKTKVLMQKAPGFELLETIRWTPDEGASLREAHLDRMEASADYFDYPFSRRAAARLLEDFRPEDGGDALGADSGPEGGKGPSIPEGRRLRLLLNRKGVLSLQDAPLPVPASEPWVLRPAASPIDLKNPLFRHKTTAREIYGALKRDDADDTVLWNERGEITETTIGNLAVRIGGRLCTPPASSGLLEGTLRRHLLETGDLEERVISLEELGEAQEIYLINSVRGKIPARYIGDPT
jgi:para-aminobenzoate synthetase/4-amino-4-deoxychorismate lyase